MKKKVRKWWIKALEGSAKAYRKLGIYALEKDRDRRLSYLCLEKAVEIGDEKAFFLFHQTFSQGKKVISDKSYREMAEDYRRSESPGERKKLKAYLSLGTKEQAETFWKGIGRDRT